MGQEFCKGCQDIADFRNNEGNFSNLANQPIRNIKNPIYTQNTNTISVVNEGALNNDTSFSVSNYNNHKQSESIPLSNLNNPYANNTQYNNLNNYDNNINNIYNDYNDEKNTNNNFNLHQEQNTLFTKKGRTSQNYGNNEENKEQNLDKYVKLITKYMRKLKNMKETSHENIKKISYTLSDYEYLQIYNNNYELDVDLFPDKNYFYLGTYFNDHKDGYGLEVFTNCNAKYFGRFINGYRVDYGRFIINNNIKSYNFFGEIKGLFANGYGWHQNNNECSSYEGTWKNSKKDGYGIEYYKDNSVYQGCFSEGKKNGIGLYKWADNSSYMGEWGYNKLEGYGIYKFKDGSIYKGQWKSNRMEGLGEFTFPDTKSYIGFFHRDKRAGFGILVWYNESKAFIGFWADNKQNGYGKFIANNKIRFGFWQDGTIQQKFKSENELVSNFNNEEKKYLAFFKFNDYEEICDLIKKILL